VHPGGVRAQAAAASAASALLSLCNSICMGTGCAPSGARYAARPATTLRHALLRSCQSHFGKGVLAAVDGQAQNPACPLRCCFICLVPVAASVLSQEMQQRPLPAELSVAVCSDCEAIGALFSVLTAMSGDTGNMQ